MHSFIYFKIIFVVYTHNTHTLAHIYIDVHICYCNGLKFYNNKYDFDILYIDIYDTKIIQMWGVGVL
jgi:hypothetical protein